MAYIYKITNKLNGKSYVGKTIQSVEERWRCHVRDSKKVTNEKRPLYNAFNKYGVENFSIEILEEVDVNDASNREKYWIEKLATFKYGYNATIGGDGRQYIDYDMVIKLYQEFKNQNEVAILMGITQDSVKSILDNNKIETLSRQALNELTHNKGIKQIDIKTGEVISVFNSIKEAENHLGKTNTHIYKVCKGERKTACGFRWEYI